MIKKISISFVFLMIILSGSIIGYQYFTASMNYHWPKNKEVSYDLHFISKGSSYDKNNPLSLSMVKDQKVSVEVKGKLKITNAGMKDGDHLLEISLIPSKFLYEYKYDTIVNNTESRKLNFIASWNEIDGFGDLYLEKIPTNEYEHLIKDILNLIQIKHPKDAFFQWSAKHRTLYGDEDAYYEFFPNIFLGLGSDCLDKEFNTSKESKVFSGVIEYCFNKSAVIDSVQGERIEAYYNSSNKIADNKKSISLVFSGIKDALKKSEVNLSELVLRNVDGSYSKAELDKKLDVNAIGGRTLQDIVSPLKFDKELKIDDQSNTFGQLAAYLRLYPEKTGVLKDMLYDYTVDDYQFALLSTALRSSGTLESRAVLEEYVGASAGNEKSQILLNLSFMEPPAERTVDLFIEMYESTSSSREANRAVMGLGIMASKAEAGSAIKEKIITTLIDQYEAASEIEKKRGLIRAMANTRDPYYIELLSRDIVSYEALKYEIIKAFKNIKSYESQKILIDFTKSSDADERYLSYHSLGGYEIDFSISDRYEDAIYNDKEKKIIEVVLKNLVDQKGNVYVKNIAEEYLGRCPTTRFCNLAKEML